MSPPGAAVRVEAQLSAALLQSRRCKLAEKAQELLRQHWQIQEQRREDGTLHVPRIIIRVSADPGQNSSSLKAVTWTVACGGAPPAQATHVLLCFTPREFVTEADKDGLGSVLHSARAAFSGCRLHLLTYDAGSTARPDPAAAAAAAAAAGGGAAAAPAAHDGKERLWQLVAELAVWHRDVCIHNAQSLDHAAQFVHRVTRAVAEERFKQMTASSYISVLPLSATAKETRQNLDRAMGQLRTDRGGSQAALLRALAAVHGVTWRAAVAVGLRYRSLLELTEAVERDAAGAQATIASQPLYDDTSNSAVGQTVAERIVRFVCGTD